MTPLVLAGLLVFSFSALGLRAGFLSLLDSAALRKMLLVFDHSDVVWFDARLAARGLCRWLALRALARGYEAKAFSDTQLVVDSWWLNAAFSISVSLATVRQWWGLLGLLVFVAYRAVVTVGSCHGRSTGERGRTGCSCCAFSASGAAPRGSSTPSQSAGGRQAASR